MEEQSRLRSIALSNCDCNPFNYSRSRVDIATLLEDGASSGQNGTASGQECRILHCGRLLQSCECVSWWPIAQM